jgi:hypothetical protein
MFVEWVLNGERTRWFLAMNLARPDNDGLNRLLHLSNTVVTSFGQLPLYTLRGKHISSKRRCPESREREREEGDDSHHAVDYGLAPDLADHRVDCSSLFHVSLAWSLSEPSNRHIECSRSPEDVNAIKQNIASLSIRFDSIKTKIGNAVSVVPLQVKAEEEKGLLGL